MAQVITLPVEYKKLHALHEKTKELSKQIADWQANELMRIHDLCNTNISLEKCAEIYDEIEASWDTLFEARNDLDDTVSDFDGLVDDFKDRFADPIKLFEYEELDFCNEKSFSENTKQVATEMQDEDKRIGFHSEEIEGVGKDDVIIRLDAHAE